MKRCVHQCVVAELLFMINTIEVNLEDTEKAQSREGTVHLKGSPELGQPRPANRKEEGPREWSIHEGAQPMLHGKRPDVTTGTRTQGSRRRRRATISEAARSRGRGGMAAGARGKGVAVAIIEP